MDAFTLTLAAGTFLGLVQVARHAPRGQTLEWLDAAAVTLLAALAGARLSFVFLHVEYFRARMIEIPQVWLGGLDWPGAVVGAFVGVLIIAALRDLPLGETADHMAHLAPPLAIAAWLGCWADGCAYGAPSTFLALPAADAEGVVTGRFPVQMLAALLLLGYYAWLELRVSRPLRAGRRAGLIGLGLALNLLLFSFLRDDPARLWLGFRADTWAAALFAVWMLAVSLWPTRAARASAQPLVEKTTLRESI